MMPFPLPEARPRASALWEYRSRTLAQGLSIPVFCKIRLLGSGLHGAVRETAELCCQLAEAGAALIAIHGRYRCTPTQRRPGPAMLDQVAAVKAACANNAACRGVPIISNGNVRDGKDVVANLLETVRPAPHQAL